MHISSLAIDSNKYGIKAWRDKPKREKVILRVRSFLFWVIVCYRTTTTIPLIHYRVWKVREEFLRQMIVCLFLFFLEFVSWEFFLLRMSNSLSHSSEIYPSLGYFLSYQLSLSLSLSSSLHHLFIPHVLMLASMRNYTRGNVSSQQKVAHELRLFLPRIHLYYIIIMQNL